MKIGKGLEKIVNFGCFCKDETQLADKTIDVTVDDEDIVTITDNEDGTWTVAGVEIGETDYNLTSEGMTMKWPISCIAATGVAIIRMFTPEPEIQYVEPVPEINLIPEPDPETPPEEEPV